MEYFVQKELDQNGIQWAFQERASSVQLIARQIVWLVTFYRRTFKHT